VPCLAGRQVKVGWVGADAYGVDVELIRPDDPLAADIFKT
jgi:hypothetical protein